MSIHEDDATIIPALQYRPKKIFIQQIEITLLQHLLDGKIMRLPLRSTRAAASVKKKTELPILRITKLFNCRSMSPSGAPFCNCVIVSL